MWPPLQHYNCCVWVFAFAFAFVSVFFLIHALFVWKYSMDVVLLSWDSRLFSYEKTLNLLHLGVITCNHEQLASGILLVLTFFKSTPRIATSPKIQGKVKVFILATSFSGSVMQKCAGYIYTVYNWDETMARWHDETSWYLVQLFDHVALVLPPDSKQRSKQIIMKVSHAWRVGYRSFHGNMWNVCVVNVAYVCVFQLYNKSSTKLEE